MAGINGPFDYWSEELPPSRGQFRTLAELACTLLDHSPPKSRREASVLISRMQLALGELDAPSPAAATASRPL
jgi:hypothetical protein